MRIAIIGLGHIGGSLALALKELGDVKEIIGVDENLSHIDKSVQLGLISRSLNLNEACKEADMVVLAVPVNAIRELLPKVLDEVPDHVIVTDVGSTKNNICEVVETHTRRNQYVAVHPIAGKETSGPEAATEALFEGKKLIICDREKSNPKAVEKVEDLWRKIGMDIIHMGSEEHDTHLAYISHVSHLTSFSLALSVLRAEENEELIFKFAGSGFDSTARLAKSSPEMWAPIFLENQEPIISVLDQYIQILQDFKKDIESGDRSALISKMQEANKIKRILAGKIDHHGS